MSSKWEKMAPFVRGLPCEERKAITAAAVAFSEPQIQRRTAIRKLERIVYSIHRTEARRHSDKVTDGKRRILVGTRVHRSIGEHYREIAKARGMSLNKWVAAALEKAAADQE